MPELMVSARVFVMIAIGFWYFENVKGKMMSSGFVAGTLVHTDKGLIPIQNLQVGDLVWSKSCENNFDNNNESSQPIVNLQTYLDTEIWKIESLPDSESGGEYLLFGGENTLIWVYGDSEGYEGTPMGWTKANEELETSSGVFLKGLKKGIVSYCTETMRTILPNVGFTMDTGLEEGEEYLIDFSNLQIYFIYDIFNPCFSKENFPSKAQGTIYIDAKDIAIDGDIWNKELKFDKFPLVTTFIENYTERKGKRPNPAFFKTTVYQLEVADNHNYFVGKLGILVGDSTIQGISE